MKFSDRVSENEFVNHSTNPLLMLVITILYLLLAANLLKLMSEKSTSVFKDVRFWLVILSLGLLIFLTIKGYSG